MENEVSDNTSKNVVSVSDEIAKNLIKVSDNVSNNRTEDFTFPEEPPLVEDKKRDIAFEALKIINDIIWTTAEFAAENRDKSIKLAVFGSKIVNTGILASAIHIAKELADGKDLNRALAGCLPELAEEGSKMLYDALASKATLKLLGNLGSRVFGAIFSEIIFNTGLNEGEAEWVIEMQKKNKHPTPLEQTSKNASETLTPLQPIFPSLPDLNHPLPLSLPETKVSAPPTTTNPPPHVPVPAIQAKSAKKISTYSKLESTLEWSRKNMEKMNEEKHKADQRRREERKRMEAEQREQLEARRKKEEKEREAKRKKEDEKRKQEQTAKYKASCENAKHAYDAAIKKAKHEIARGGNPSTSGFYSKNSNTSHRSICGSTLSSKQSLLGIGIGVGKGPVRMGFVPYNKK